jgi:CheY-like chemotaxis protein
MLRVLVVEDHNSQSQTLETALASNGFEVKRVSSAGEAFDVLASQPMDLALIDLMIPGLNGLALARRMSRTHPETRVVLTSAYHLSARQLERADCGAVGFVPKPCKIADLCSFLRSKTKPLAVWSW